MDGSHISPYDAFSKSMRAQMWRVNALLMLNAILVALMVGIGVYGHRYRHRPITRFLYDGAASLFLPIMSYVVSDNGAYYITGFQSKQRDLMAGCDVGAHMFLVLLWTGLVQIAAINSSAIAAGGDREGRTISPLVVLLVQAIWTSYLAVHNAWLGKETFENWYHSEFPADNSFDCLLFIPFAIIFAKLVYKFYAFYKCRQSFALVRNPCVVVGYMEHLDGGSQHSEHAPPPLLVMGEETVQVEEQPHGYYIKKSEQHGTSGMEKNMLVTIDKIWQLDNMLLGSRSTTRFKDICLSFALFKLSRCLFLRYTIAEAGLHKVCNFFWHVLLKDGEDPERILWVIEDELAFLYDYHYSSLPMSYSNSWLPILSIFTSLSSILYCLFAVTALKRTIQRYSIFRQLEALRSALVEFEGNYQALCYIEGSGRYLHFGSLYFDLVPVYLLLALVVLTEAWEIASYICSNWTKVALICRYVNHNSWQQSPILRKWVGRVIKCRCNLLKHWENKMNQCSILVLHPWKTPLALLRHLIHLPDQEKKVPRAVKAAVLHALRSYEGSQNNGVASLRRCLQVGDNHLWTFNGKGTAETILVCHIATSILEVRSQPHRPLSNHKIAATHLSRYCAYLVAYSPELLPDNDSWCKSLYMYVKKDAQRVLGSGIAVSTPEEEYQELFQLLSEESNHEVIKNGAKLGKQLVELSEGEEKAWEVLSGFWSELVLYAAPSDNVDAHAEAIARGGELITLLWALLNHVGIVSRPDAAAAAAATAIEVVVISTSQV